MAITAQDILTSQLNAISSGHCANEPYPNWFLENCIPTEAVDEILSLPFPAPSLDGVSGKRELHNKTRTYFDQENMDRYPVCKAFNEAFQSRQMTSTIENHFGIDLSGTYLRVEFAQDTDGFWLEPHTDLGVKSFTMLLYMSKDETHENLGTDFYHGDKKHAGRSPFRSNTAFIFVPSDNTYHGFEPRKIEGIRKSIIINYVTDEWRAREQLPYPNTPIQK